MSRGGRRSTGVTPPPSPYIRTYFLSVRTCNQSPFTLYTSLSRIYLNTVVSPSLSNLKFGIGGHIYIHTLFGVRTGLASKE